MSESVVQVNPDGTGKQIRTELVAGVHQQVVTLADSAGTLLDTQLGNLNLSLTALRDAITAVGGAAKTLADVVTAIQSSQPRTVANLDVALSTRTKPADQQHAIIDSGTTAVTQASGANLHANIDNFPATQPVSGTVAVTNFTNPLPTTDALQDPAFAAPGAAVPALSILHSGTDGALVRNVRLATDGRMQLNDGDTIVTELRMIRQGISLLLSEFSGRGVDLTTLNELEAI